jgi:hypothetical protein
MMGYRSNVTYIIRFPSRKIAKEFIAVQRLIPEIGDAINELKYVDSTMPRIVGEFIDVNWYPEDEGIRNHVAFLSNAGDQGFAWAIAKIGEDDSDVEIDHCDGEHPAYPEVGIVSLYDELYVERRIRCSVNIETSVNPVEFLLSEGEEA